MAANAGKPTLHHLNNSQSLRVLWLLEELGIPYNLVEHFRLETARAPPELLDIHPMGKAPLLSTADGVIIAESSTIITYLLKTYDTEKKFSGSMLGDGSSTGWVRDDSLVSFSGSSLGSVMGIELLLDIAGKRTPWGFKSIVKYFTGGIHNMFTGPELTKGLKYLETQLGDEKWFSKGAEPGRADFVISWPLDMMSQRKWFDFGTEFPKLAKFIARYQSRDGYKRALEKGGEYDLNGF